MKQKIPQGDLFFHAFEILKAFSKKGTNKYLLLSEIEILLKDINDSVSHMKESIELLLSKKLLIKRGASYALGKKMPIQTEGVLSSHFRGFGFVSFQGGLWNEVFIPKQKMRGAVDGDLVQVSIDYSRMDKKGPDGSVEAIIERNRKSLVGTIKHSLPNGDVTAHSSLINDTIIVRKKEKEEPLNIGDRVSIKINNWGDEGADLEGELEENQEINDGHGVHSDYISLE